MEEVNQADFEQQVLQSSTPVLVEFGAVWCAPCKRLEPELEKLAALWGNKIRVMKVDVDYNTDLTMIYQVMSVPTLILFVNGQPCERLSSYQPYQRLVERFQPHIFHSV